jgi:uncharacterized membrane protein
VTTADRRGSGIAALTVTLMAGLVPVASVLAACSSVAPIPDRSEASAFVEHLYPLAEQGEFDALCAAGGGNCEAVLADAGEDAVPSVRPNIVDTFELPTHDTGDGTMRGGLVVVVCGVDARDRSFRTEMLVFRDGNQLRVIEPVYWSGMGVATSTVTNSKPQSESC